MCSTAPSFSRTRAASTGPPYPVKTVHHLLRTITVGAQPIAVAVDEQTRRTVVVNAGGTVGRPTGWWVLWAQVVRRWLPQRVLLALPGVAPQVTARTVPGTVSVLDLARV